MLRGITKDGDTKEDELDEDKGKRENGDGAKEKNEIRRTRK